MQESKYNEILNVKAFSNIKAYKATIYMSFFAYVAVTVVQLYNKDQEKEDEIMVLSHKYLNLFSYIQGSSLV